MKLDELASLMNIPKEKLIEQLKQNDVIELKLIERLSSSQWETNLEKRQKPFDRKNGMIKDNFKIEVLK